MAELAQGLHQDQVQGKIDRDVLIFVNFDADDEFWVGYDLPWHLSWLPNTGGLAGLVKEVEGLDYVRFTTLAGYLKNHHPPWAGSGSARIWLMAISTVTTVGPRNP